MVQFLGSIIGIIAEKCHDHYYDKKYNRNETKDIIIEEDTLHCEEHKHNNDTSYDICDYYKDISKIDKNLIIKQKSAIFAK